MLLILEKRLTQGEVGGLDLALSRGVTALLKPGHYHGQPCVVHLNFRAGSTVPVSVCKVDAVRLYASCRLNLLLLKRQRCVLQLFRMP